NLKNHFYKLQNKIGAKKIIFYSICIISLFILFISLLIIFLNNTYESSWRDNTQLETLHLIQDIEKFNEKNINYSIINEYYLINLQKSTTQSRILLREKSKSLYQEFGINSDELINLYNNYDDKIIIIDLRKKLEFEKGQIPNSIHIRDTDFILNNWTQFINSNKTIILVCFSDLISAPFSEFLNRNNIQANYLIGGISNNHNNKNFPFQGELDDSFNVIFEYYLNPNLIFEYNKNQVFIDVRPPFLEKNNFLNNNLNLKEKDLTNLEKNLNMSIPLFFDALTSNQINTIIDSLNSNYQYVILCNSPRNCWSGYNVILELESKNLNIKGIVDLENSFN
ncbi:MAG: rhodanese-like domain-containing protein, partial [Nanoarchaeota archaeon]|nr:rhodanese-like domain-containing protein [Nanoarchaeota archaeon]